MKKVNVFFGGLILFFLYLASYGFLSSYYGRYEPAAYGLQEGADGNTVLAPKKSFGQIWVVFDYDQTEDRANIAHVIYVPLVYLDRRIWHRRGEISIW